MRLWIGILLLLNLLVYLLHANGLFAPQVAMHPLPDRGNLQLLGELLEEPTPSAVTAPTLASEAQDSREADQKVAAPVETDAPILLAEAVSVAAESDEVISSAERVTENLPLEVATQTSRPATASIVTERTKGEQLDRELALLLEPEADATVAPGPEKIADVLPVDQLKPQPPISVEPELTAAADAVAAEKTAALAKPVSTEVLPSEKVAVQANEPQALPVPTKPSANDQLASVLTQPEQEEVVQETGSIDRERAAPEPVLLSRTCWKIGTFDARGAVDDMRESLPASASVLGLAAGERLQRVGYYVMIPAAADRASAQQTLLALKKVGVVDTWLFPSGPYKNAISLGLFSQERNAKSRVNEIKDKGFVAEMVAKQRITPRFELYIAAPDAVVKTLTLGAQKIVEVACDALPTDLE